MAEQKHTAGCTYMHKSKLESYEAILGALTKKPLGIDRLAYKTNMDCTVLHNSLQFLMANELVEECMSNNSLLYAITERGTTVFRTLDFQKYLRKISKTLMAIDNTIGDVPIILKRRQKLPE